jgi:hypothetical protein
MVQMGMVILFPNLAICGGSGGSGVPLNPATLPLCMIELVVSQVVNGDKSDEKDESELAKICQFLLLTAKSA